MAASTMTQRMAAPPLQRRPRQRAPAPTPLLAVPLSLAAPLPRPFFQWSQIFFFFSSDAQIAR